MLFHDDVEVKQYAGFFLGLAALTCMAGVLLFAGMGCRKEVVEPPPVSDIGRRDYTWTVDTLKAIGSSGVQLLSYAIWGTSPHHLYIVSRSNNAMGSIHHFDGNAWKPVKITTAEGGSIEDCWLRAIYGFSEGDIWAGGERSGDEAIILHYNGSSWNKVTIAPGGRVLAIWGAAPNDIWAGGGSRYHDGSLYHYDGAVWTKFPIDSSIFINDIAGFSSTDVYAVAARFFLNPDSSENYELYLRHWNGEQWTDRDSFIISDSWKFGSRLWAGPNHTLYSACYGVYRYREYDNIWEQLINNEMPLRIGGSSNKNIFAVGDEWAIRHWNGSDWRTINAPFTGFGYFTAVWTNNVETFLVGHDGRATYIVHGR